MVRIEKNSTLFLLSLQFVRVQGENTIQNGPLRISKILARVD